MLTFMASIFVFGMLIFFHELGHFMLAKLVGIKVREFSLGFGPKIFGMHRGETAYNLRALPLGGFVRMAGMDPNEEEEDVDEERGFNRKTIGQRAAVIFAGPLMNFLLAVLLLAVIFIFQGLPVPSNSTRVGEVIPGFPAEKAGIVANDRIVAVNGQRVETWEEMVGIINGMPEQKILIDFEREGTLRQVELVTARDENGLGKIGVYQANDFVRVGPLRSLALGAEWTGRVTVMILDFISKMLFGQVPADLGGPVRVVSEIGKAAQVGFFFLLQLSAFLSINLGLFNLFPIPALDGSRILFLAWEKIRGRPVDPVKENFIHLVGFGLLLLLMVVITYNDILQIYILDKIPEQ
ncbi:MAG: RIP metalloprotease RseP [Pelotomaculum sp.]|uniref:Zinc metalloprotease n=1 Tax=Pelotomaculum thermopropionicum (strain DSM 13744 / JCM 10971 / SI) TaxID=370438 RepID=A5D2U4_PELTS|nr:RIP metalloprotease RseP [Pelotomaculum sp.]BAF59442.1 predicted membrane-associated Zn-dependent protease 1 [Pelotomaculum thermopropionicum SI]